MSAERTNAERGDDGMRALDAHASAFGRRAEWPESKIVVTRAHRREPVQDRLCDLLTDLHHLADGHGVDWAYVLRIAALNHEAERNGG